MRKLSIIVFLMFSLMLSGMAQAASIDVTAPGDTIKGVPDDANSWPVAEAPQYVIDNKADTKYLNFRGATETTGIQVTAALGGMIVTELTLTTGNDAPERDPVTVEIYGSNDSIDGPYTLIDTVEVVDFSQVDPWPRGAKNETPILIDNAVAYDHYQVLITAVRVFDNGCCMQVAEVELLATLPDLTAPWVYKDIGTASGGNAWEDAGAYIVRAGGHDIWGNSDGLGYLCRPMSGDGSVEVKLTSMDVTNDWAKAGVMIRETSAADSKFALMAMSGVNGVALAYRSSTGGGCADMQTAGQSVPEILKLSRVGDEFYAQYGFELAPGMWVMVDQGSVMIPMSSDVLIGLAVTSHNTDLLCMSVFEEMVLDILVFNGPWDMAPADGSTGLPSSPTLTWLPGEGAVTHDVYLGTDSAALPLVDTKALGDESYTPDTPLMAGTVYYWQIVEQPGDHAGLVYSFTTYAPPTGILREVWEGIGGTEVPPFTSLPEYPCCPTWSDKLTSMASYDLGIDNYGAHMQGLLWPETSGDYTFWIAADDGTELWLSTDADPANLTKIAEHVGWNNAHNWYDSAEQQSAPVSLVGGQMYWIRGIWKEGGGGDNCQVAWQGPDQPDAPVQGSDSAVVTNYWFPLDSLELSGFSPADGTPLTLLEAEDGISWSAKRGATYDVYFGEEGGSMALIASGTETSATPPVELGKTYNWKVDAVYDTEVVEGPVLSFSVQEWVSVDIGRANPEPAGSSSVEDGVYTLKAGGNELWGGADEFHYLYTTMEMTRDTGIIQARVMSIAEPDSWRRAGVMIRESRAPNAAKVMAHKTGHDRTRMQWRDYTGAGTGAGDENPGLGFPMWVRVVREGSQFNGYYSQGGENWSHLGSRNVTMTNDYVLVGLALCHHNSVDQAALTTGIFENLTITTPDIGQAWNPSPSNGAENVPLYTTLSWGAGDNADEHRLYISENRDDVYYGLIDPVVLPAETTEYEVGPLNLTKPYYWAVDEVIKEGRDWPVTLGDVWSFKVENYRLVEDFEPYDDPPVPIEDLPEQVVIEDGYTIPGYTIPAVEPDSACLLALYDFEADANDSSGNGYDGILIGDANVDGGVLILDGDGDYVDCGNPDALNFGTGDWSICAWVKNTMAGTGDENKGSIVANGGDGGGGHRYGLLVSEQTEAKVTLVTDDNVDKRQALSMTSVNDDVWRSVVGVREGGNIKIYVDGMLEATTGLPDGYDLSGTSQANVLIGAITLAADGTIYKTYAGQIDKVRIYNCAMTEENIRWLAEIGDLVIPDVIVPPVYGPMIAEYLIELTDPTADTSGNNFHGVPYGDVTIVEDAVRGYVASFDGDGDAVNIGNDPMFNPAYEDFSVSTWINMSSYGGNWGNVIIGKRGEGGLGWQIRRLSDTQRLSFTTRNCGDQDGWGSGGQNVSLNEWHHVAAVRQGLQKWLYVDGVQEAVSDICDYIAECNHDVYIGARANGDNTGPESNFNGMIDDVRYYKNHALTYGEVLNLLEYEITNPIHDTWVETGAAITLDYFERHWGAKSMKIESTGSGKVNRDVPFEDWGSGDAKAMVMYFRGDPANVIDDMYMALDVKGPVELAHTSFSYEGDVDDLSSGDWTEWNIDLTDIGGVRKISLGLTSDVGGTINFDDLRLYPSRCVAMYGPMADFTGDCLVDAKDARVIALDWLERDYTVYAVEPDVAGLVARYEFDGDVNDISGNGNDGTIIGDGITEDDPERGMVLSLPGGDDQYVSLPEVGISGNDPTTITCWAKADHTSIPDWTLVFGFSTEGGGCGSHFNIGSIGGPGGVGAHLWCWESTIFTDTEALEWRHYAMTFDGTTTKSYGDGFQIAQTNTDLAIRGDRVNIGKRNTQASSFPGKVDDARIYNYQLSTEEILSIAGVDEVYYPIESIANLYDEEPVNSKFINFKDYATLMEEWLYEQQWPN